MPIFLFSSPSSPEQYIVTNCLSFTFHFHLHTLGFIKLIFLLPCLNISLFPNALSSTISFLFNLSLSFLHSLSYSLSLSFTCMHRFKWVSRSSHLISSNLPHFISFSAAVVSFLRLPLKQKLLHAFVINTQTIVSLLVLPFFAKKVKKNPRVCWSCHEHET